jgi:alanine racemase
MDLLTIDVSGVEGRPVCAGDEVELFGGAVSIDEIAEAADTISYELLTRLGRRVERRYVDDAGDTPEHLSEAGSMRDE